MLQDYVERIENSRVYSAANETPLQAVSILSRRLENRVYLKREDLQPVFSFKLRGAFNKMAGLSANARKRGVIAASAGNHAQGIALAAKRLDMQALIVMPQTTPQIKLESVRALGAAIELKGSNYDEAFEFAQHKAEELGSTFIHPYDDKDVIAGQGTVAMEILRQDAVAAGCDLRPGRRRRADCRHGGLCQGAAAGAFAWSAWNRGMRPAWRVRSQPENVWFSMTSTRSPMASPCARLGRNLFELRASVSNEVVTVTHREICTAIKEIFDDSRCIAEPAGALALAGLKRCVAREEWTGKVLVAVVSGANVDFDRLRGIAELADLVERREALLGVTIPERPGSFRTFCQAIGQRSITEFNYRYADAEKAHVFVGVELRNGRSDKEELTADLTNRGYKVVDLSDNEMARIHVRYMVGGRAAGLRDERLFRFDLPEQPGALLRYLTRMGKRWNISLFHYRSHGAAYGQSAGRNSGAGRGTGAIPCLSVGTELPVSRGDRQFGLRTVPGIRSMTHTIVGACHCGNLSFELTTRTALDDIVARSCECSFCQKHGATYWADPKGSDHDSNRGRALSAEVSLWPAGDRFLYLPRVRNLPGRGTFGRGRRLVSGQSATDGTRRAACAAGEF